MFSIVSKMELALVKIFGEYNSLFKVLVYKCHLHFQKIEIDS